MTILCCIARDDPFTPVGWVMLHECPRVGELLLCTVDNGTAIVGRVADISRAINLLEHLLPLDRFQAKPADVVVVTVHIPPKPNPPEDETIQRIQLFLEEWGANAHRLGIDGDDLRGSQNPPD